MSKSERDFVVIIKQGTEAFLNQSYDLAITHLEKAISEFNLAALLSDIDILVLKYTLYKCYIYEPTCDRITQIINYLLTQEDRFGVEFPALYYLLAEALCRFFRYEESQIVIEKGLKVLRENGDFYNFYWPLSTQPMLETYPDDLKEMFFNLMLSCRKQPEPDLKCCFEECPSVNIYFASLDYTGYTQVSCCKKCKVVYHHACWEIKNKDKFNSVSNFEDEVLANDLCLLCDSAIEDVTVFDSKNRCMKIFKSKNICGTVRKKPKEVQLTQNKPKKRLLKNILSSEQLLAQVNMIREKIKQNNENISELFFDPSQVYLGLTPWSETDQFVSDEDDPLKSVKEFIYSFFFEILVYEGSKTCVELEEFWKDQKEYFPPEAETVTKNGIIKFLNASHRFAVISDMVTLSEIIPLLYEETVEKVSSDADKFYHSLSPHLQKYFFPPLIRSLPDPEQVKTIDTYTNKETDEKHNALLQGSGQLHKTLSEHYMLKHLELNKQNLGANDILDLVLPINENTDNSLPLNENLCNKWMNSTESSNGLEKTMTKVGVNLKSFENMLVFEDCHNTTEENTRSVQHDVTFSFFETFKSLKYRNANQKVEMLDKSIQIDDTETESHLKLLEKLRLCQTENAKNLSELLSYVETLCNSVTNSYIERCKSKISNLKKIKLKVGIDNSNVTEYLEEWQQTLFETYAIKDDINNLIASARNGTTFDKLIKIIQTVSCFPKEPELSEEQLDFYVNVKQNENYNSTNLFWRLQSPISADVLDSYYSTENKFTSSPYANDNSYENLNFDISPESSNFCKPPNLTNTTVGCNDVTQNDVSNSFTNINTFNQGIFDHSANFLKGENYGDNAFLRSSTTMYCEDLEKMLIPKNDVPDSIVSDSCGSVSKNESLVENLRIDKKNSSYARLMHYLQKTFSHKPIDDILSCLQTVREGNGGSLSGLNMQDITNRVSAEFYAKEQLNPKKGLASIINNRPIVVKSVAENRDLECSICMENMDRNKVCLLCKHVFHRDCIKTWLSTNNICPICRVFTCLQEDQFPKLKR